MSASSHRELESADRRTSTRLTPEMKDMIARLRLSYAATVTPDNKPNLSPKGSLKVLDDEHLIFAEMASPNTVRNLEHNPAIEINIVDPILRRGYRFKGVAEILTDPDLITLAGQGLGAEYPVRRVVKIRVEIATAVSHPSTSLPTAGKRTSARCGCRSMGSIGPGANFPLSF